MDKILVDRVLLERVLHAIEYSSACISKQLTTQTKHDYALGLLAEANDTLRASLEQPVKQEPVAYVGGHRNGWFYLNGRPKVKIGDALYAAPQQSIKE